jgi:shikimate kinase
MSEPGLPVVGVVGPCCSGKSTLVRALRERGYPAKDIAQEHSFAPRMWQIVGQAEVLVYLDVSYAVAQQRRRMDWRPEDLAEEQRRLQSARERCDLYLNTDALTPEQVQAQVLGFLGTSQRAGDPPRSPASLDTSA